MTRATTLLALSALLLAACKEGPPGDRGPEGLQGDTGQQGLPGDDNTVPGSDGEPNLILTEDTTWSVSQQIAGMVFVEPGVTLTIEPGTQVDFLPSGALYVEGVLVADADGGAPIVFASITPFSDSVGGVSIAGDADASSLHNVSVQGLDLNLAGAVTDTITDLELTSGNLRIVGDDTGLAIEGCDFGDAGVTAGTRIFALDTPSLSISGCTLQGGERGIHLKSALAMDLDLQVSNAEIGGMSGRAITLEGDATQALTFDLDGVTIDATAITVQNAPVISALDASGTVSWLEVTSDGATCIDAYQSGKPTTSSTLGDLSVSHSTLTGCGYGIRAGKHVTVDTTTIVNASEDGISCNELVLTDSTVQRSRTRGVSVGSCAVSGSLVTENGSAGLNCIDAGTATILIEDSVISDNGGNGFQGGYGDAFDLVGNNITGNAGFAAQWARLLDGNYIADNKGFTGVDTTAGGTIDGNLDITSDQLEQVDAVTNPQSTPLSGVGPR